MLKTPPSPLVAPVGRIVAGAMSLEQAGGAIVIRHASVSEPQQVRVDVLERWLLRQFRAGLLPAGSAK